MRRALTALVPRGAAVCSIAIGVAALAGWLLDLPGLKSVLPQEAALEANTAIALVLAGVALLRLGAAGGRRYDVTLMAGAVFALGLATLAQYVFALDLRIDELFFRDVSPLPGTLPGRMSPYSAVALVGIGLALAAFHTPSLRPLVWAAAALTGFIGAVPMAGHLIGASSVVTNRWLSPVAATVAFVLLGVGTIVASAAAGRSAQAPAARSSLEKKVLGAFAGALVLLFVGAGFTYRAGVDLADSIAGISRSEQLRDALSTLHVVPAGAEAAQSAYLLTDRAAQREEYEYLAAAARSYLQAITGALAADASQAREVEALQTHVERRLALLADVTALYERNGLSSARELIASDEGVREMAAIHMVTGRMDSRGEEVLLEREETLARTRQLTLGSLLLTLAVAAGIFLTLFRGISREMAARAQADQALRERNREILALNAALEQRAADVEAANTELESFSYSVSHDLRAPLRHIDGYIEMLKEETAGQLGAQAERYLAVIADSSRRMSALIEDLLAFSRTGRTELNMGRVELDDLVKEVVANLEMLTRGRTIVWDIAPLPPVTGDHALLRQVLANLLGNALKYTRTREVACIAIGCEGDEDGKSVFFVRDNGVGFDMQHAGKLFGLFQRLHRAVEFDGSGIGLANVRRIVGRHGGRVWAHAEPARGATFYFSLRRAPDAASRPRTAG